jgi:DNA ligase-1
MIFWKQMLFAKLSSYFDRLEKTSGRLEMTAILADLLREAGDDEVRQICYFALGRLGPLYEALDFKIAGKLMLRILARAYNVSEEEVKKMFGDLGDLGDVACKLSAKSGQAGEPVGSSKVQSAKLSVEETFDRLYKVAQREGAGSVEQKIVGTTELLQLSEPLSAKYIVRIPLGNMRLGFSEKTIIEALSWMERGDKGLKKEIEAAYHLYPDVGEIASRIKEKGVGGVVREVGIKVGAPVLPARCQRVETPEEMIEKQGGRVLAEPKFDGERIQMHLDRGRKMEDGGQTALGLEEERPKFLVKMFTRNLEEVSSMFPELVTAAAVEIKANQVVLDGEVVGVDPKTSKFIPFQETIQRKRKYGVKEKAQEVPVKYFVFDILHKDGKDLLELPFAERRKILEEMLGGIKGSKGVKGVKDDERIELTPQKEFTDPQKLQKFLKEEVKGGTEGLVVKDPRAKYEAGARGFSWIKYKPEKDTIDAVVLGYYFGKGKRADFGIGAFLIGVYDEKSDGFKTLSKIGTGLSDEQWRELKVKSEKLKVKSPPKGVDVPQELTPDVGVRPEMVVVIKYDEISKSPLHTAGYALRFPRLVSFREDKSATEATTTREIKEMFKGQ